MTESQGYTVRKSIQRSHLSGGAVLAQVDSIDEAMAIAIPQSHAAPIEVWGRGEVGFTILRWIVRRGTVYERTPGNWPTLLGIIARLRACHYVCTGHYACDAGLLEDNEEFQALVKLAEI